MKCTEPIPVAGGDFCGRECYKLPVSFDPLRFYWMCPTHGQEKLLSESYKFTSPREMAIVEHGQVVQIES